MNDIAPTIQPELKAARNKAIEFHNQSLTSVGHDRMLAYRLLCSSVTVDPGLASGWSGLGNALADLHMLPASIAAFRRTLELPIGNLPGDLTLDLHVKALINLAHRLLNVGRIEEALKVNAKVLQLLESDPDLDPEGSAFAWTNMSLIMSIMGADLAAIEYAERAFEKSQEPIIEVGLAFALMFGGRYAEGLRHFEKRFEYRAHLNSYLEYPYRKWTGESHHGRTLFIPCEQGLGDTLSFTRFIGRAAAKVRNIIYAVQPELVRLLRASLRHWGNVEVVPLTTQFPIADDWCAVGSLPAVLGLTDEEIRDAPQGWTAQGDEAIPPDWLAADRKLHVGIAWAGSQANDIDVWRSIQFTRLLDLYRCPGIQLYSLQVGDHVKDLHDSGSAALVRDLSSYIRDATDTVGIMRALDLIIAAESFVPHLAAAIGKEVWIPLSRNGGDWRCGRHGDHPLWYSNTRLFRQGDDATWGPVFDRIVNALKERMECPSP
jgi:tetratricopeptide (TPR) repeat protein